MGQRKDKHIIEYNCVQRYITWQYIEVHTTDYIMYYICMHYTDEHNILMKCFYNYGFLVFN